MKKIVIYGLLLLFIVLTAFSIRKIQLYKYIESDEFSKDLSILQIKIWEYANVFGEFPTDYHTLSPWIFEDTCTDCRKVSKDFHKLKIKFAIQDTMFNVYWLGFYNNKDISSDMTSIDNLKWYQIFLYRGNYLLFSIYNSIDFRHNHRGPNLIRNGYPFQDNLMQERISTFLKKYSLEKIQQFNITKNKYVYLKVILTDSIPNIKIVYDSSKIVEKFPVIKNELIEYFDSTKGLNGVDSIYFSLYLYPELLNNK